jgi:hypothetical protein
MIIKITSHRARDGVEHRLGRLPQGFFSLRFNGEYREVTEIEWAKIEGMKSVSKLRRKENLHPYWNHGF